MTVKMFAPAGLGGVIHASRSGTKYTIASDGSVAANQIDVADLLNAGFQTPSRESSNATGIPTVQFNLTHMRNSDGSAIAAAASAGKFGMTITPGTSSGLISEVANANTKTDIVYDEIVLPSSYIAGQNINLTANTAITIGGGTLSVKTLLAAAYKVANDGTHGANLIATAAQNMANAAADQAFVVTGTGLNPGDRLAFNFTMVLTETGASNVSAKINSLRLS